jgi:hypothetical protein
MTIVMTMLIIPRLVTLAKPVLTCTLSVLPVPRTTYPSKLQLVPSVPPKDGSPTVEPVNNVMPLAEPKTALTLELTSAATMDVTLVLDLPPVPLVTVESSQPRPELNARPALNSCQSVTPVLATTSVLVVPTESSQTELPVLLAKPASRTSQTAMPAQPVTSVLPVSQAPIQTVTIPLAKHVEDIWPTATPVLLLTSVLPVMEANSQLPMGPPVRHAPST